MKPIQVIGIVLFAVGLLGFTGTIMVGTYTLGREHVEKQVTHEPHRELLADVLAPAYGTTYSHVFAFNAAISDLIAAKNDQLKAEGKWDQVIWDTKNVQFTLTRAAASSPLLSHKLAWLLLVVALVVGGALLYIVPRYADKPEGIKNHMIFFNSMTSGGWLGVITGTYLILFYVALYFFPWALANMVALVDPLSRVLNGNAASQWFMYGFMYTLAILVMGVRMVLKYKGNRYQLLRTGSVMFFQLCFAFLLPEIMVSLNAPYMDLKNIWPLNYTFFFEWNLDTLRSSGAIGLFMLFWGIALIIVAVPVFTYFLGKRWYCSWVCGCGGLAETLGDPYRQLSDKSLKAWKVERWMIHSVLVLAVVMTALTLLTYTTGWLGGATGQVQSWYGFLIGAGFSGVVGTGFYPFMGNRVWCRFGCPLAAYLGFVQRFKSRFRITTNGGQCISCGNCSTYCEMGIDVRWYAQRGQNIIRSSCVGCGICSAVCPRGVLKLENGPEKGRFNGPVLIGNESVNLAKN